MVKNLKGNDALDLGVAIFGEWLTGNESQIISKFIFGDARIPQKKGLVHTHKAPCPCLANSSFILEDWWRISWFPDSIRYTTNNGCTKFMFESLREVPILGNITRNSQKKQQRLQYYEKKI